MPGGGGGGGDEYIRAGVRFVVVHVRGTGRLKISMFIRRSSEYTHGITGDGSD